MTANGRRILAAITALFGAAAIAAALSFAGLPKTVAAEAARCSVAGVMLPFEFARSGADIDALFGTTGDACRATRFAAIDEQNRFDLFYFIPAYALFMALAAWFLAGGWHRPLAIGGIVCAIVAAGSDIAETASLLEIGALAGGGAAPEGTLASILAGLMAATRLKFAAIAVHGVLIALICRRLGGLYWMVGALALLGAAANLLLLLGDVRSAQIQAIWLIASGVAWLTIIAAALLEIARPRRIQG